MGVGTTREGRARVRARLHGWYFDNLAFKVDPDKHDNADKVFLGRTGNLDGVDVLKIIFEQPVTAEFLAAKIYRFLVREDLSPDLRKKLGAILRDHNYEVKPLLTAIFTSKISTARPATAVTSRARWSHFVAMMKHLASRRCRASPTSTSDDLDGPAPPEPAIGAAGPAVSRGLRQGCSSPAATSRASADSGHDRFSRTGTSPPGQRHARPAASRRLRRRRATAVGDPSR